jgi:hypothetical protein
MDIKLAPRPKNEERRVVAVKRTGVIDGGQNDNFAIFCDVAKALTGWEYVAFSLFDENFQCKISTTNGTDNDKGERDQFNVCSYVLLSSKPTLIHDFSKDEKWKNHPALKKESYFLGYAGFPVINKDNYALGSFCLMNSDPSSLSKKQIGLLKGLANRIAHQIDIQTEQKETTAASVQNVLKAFNSNVSSESFDDLNAFLSLCLGKIIPHDEYLKLSSLGLADYDSNKEIILSSEGTALQKKMKLQTKVMRRSIIKSEDKPALLDDLLGEL